MSKYLLVIISLLPIAPIFFTSLLPHTHDGSVHLARMAAFYKALLDGQFPVRWAGDLNYGYGMPLFIFIYQLPYLISSFFLHLGAGLVVTFKIVLALSFFLSGIFSYMFGKAFFDSEKKAFLFAVFYQFAPFRLVELLVRGSFGEVYTYTFLPLILCGLVLLDKKQRLRYFLLIAAATALLVLSHNALSLTFFGVCILFALFFSNNRKNFVYSLAALATGVLLASFYWIPAIVEHKYTYGDLFMKDIYKTHFPPLQNFFVPNLTNAHLLQIGGISVSFGFFHTIAIFLGIYFLFFSQKINDSSKKIIYFALLLSVFSLFLMQPISKFLWENFSLLRQFQFPWRLLGVIVLSTSLLSLMFFHSPILKKKLAYWLFVVLTIAATAFYWYRPPLGFAKVDENYYWNYPLNTTYFGETDTIWAKGKATSFAKKPVELVSGRAVIKDFTKKSNLQTFTAIAENNAVIVSNTQYFPGWKVYVNGKPTTIGFQDQNWRGLITFPVMKGENKIKIEFGESRLRFIADIISIATFGLIIIGMFKFRKYI